MDETTLDFQNFEPSENSSSNQTAVLNINQSDLFRNSSENPVGSESKSNDNSSSISFWTFEYYQQFFDVDTDQVKNRIIWGMIPRPSVNYINNFIKPNPDLYGPFWISVTLIFTIAVSGNVANYLHAPLENYHWKYDFHIISFAATTIFIYAFIVPLILWSFLKCNDSSQENPTLTFLELLCVYGYSLGIYVPVSILWVIQISWFQWILVLVGATMSGFVLMTSVAPVVRGPKKCFIISVVLALHFILAVGFMLYFFHVPPLKTVKTSVIISSNASMQLEH